MPAHGRPSDYAGDAGNERAAAPRAPRPPRRPRRPLPPHRGGAGDSAANRNEAIPIVDDQVLLREGLARLLAEAGMRVVASEGDIDGFLGAVATSHPDVAIIDIRLPPTFTDEGLRAADLLRTRHPGTAALVLSQYLDAGCLGLSERRGERDDRGVQPAKRGGTSARRGRDDAGRVIRLGRA